MHCYCLMKLSCFESFTVFMQQQQPTILECRLESSDASRGPSKGVTVCSDKGLQSHDLIRHTGSVYRRTHCERITWLEGYTSSVLPVNIINKAIRDGKYLALPHSSAWQRSPHFCCDVISLLARVFIFLIDRATQEVPIKNIWKK